MPKPSAATLTPTPATPTGGAVVALDTVTFRWTAPPGTASFDLRVAAASAPDEPLVDLNGLPTTETTLVDALPAGDMLWWVRRTGEAWSEPARFRAGTAADVEVARRAEAEAADAERVQKREERRSGAGPLTEAPPDPVWPHATGEALQGAPDLDWATVPGFETPTRSDLSTTEASPPTPLGPLGGEVVDAATVALRWSAVPGATAYEVELSPHAAFDREVLSLDAGQSTEVALPGLVPAVGRKLLWRVRARLGDAASPWSRYGRFYPAGNADVDRFRAGLDAALLAQRKQRDHAQLVRQRELDLIPLHERPDAVTSTAAVGAILGMIVSGLVVGLIALIFVLTRT